MSALSINYYNTTTISKSSIKSELQSHFQIITATILQCKELSGIMPIENNGSYANNSLLSTLECNTTTPYLLDGGRGGFIPQVLNGFTQYKASQDTNQFYFSTSVDINTTNDKVLIELNSTYSSNQYQLTDDGTKRYLKFYLSKN